MDALLLAGGLGAVFLAIAVALLHTRARPPAV